MIFVVVGPCFPFFMFLLKKNLFMLVWLMYNVQNIKNKLFMIFASIFFCWFLILFRFIEIWEICSEYDFYFSKKQKKKKFHVTIPGSILCFQLECLNFLIDFKWMLGNMHEYFKFFSSTFKNPRSLLKALKIWNNF